MKPHKNKKLKKCCNKEEVIFKHNKKFNKEFNKDFNFIKGDISKMSLRKKNINGNIIGQANL